MNRFSGKCVLITGATGNLGAALAQRFSEDGALVILFGRDPTKLDALADTLPGESLAIPVDLTDEKDVAAATEHALSKCNAIDVLCAAAGGFDMGPPVHETSADRWDAMHRINVGTLLPVLAHVGRHMTARKSGRIVTVGANATQSAVEGMGPYRAAKSAVMRITENAAAEMKALGVTANCVLPSILDTPENREAMPDADPANWVSMAEISAAICFLASDEASAVTGAMLPIVGRM